jgi:hypothetical protein
MLLSDMKGLNFRLPSLAALKKLLPENVEDDDDDSTFVTYAEVEERMPVHHDLLPSERAPAAVYAASAPPPPAIQRVSLEAEVDPELPPGTYDVHQPNLNRTDLEEPDPEIDAVVASLAEETVADPAAAPLFPEAAPAEPEPEPAAAGGGDMDDLMSFFEDVQTVSKVPSTLTEGLPKVTASELLSEARELRQMLTGRNDNAA